MKLKKLSENLEAQIPEQLRIVRNFYFEKISKEAVVDGKKRG